MGILVVHLGVVQMEVDSVGVLGVPVVLGVMRVAAVVGVTIYRFFINSGA